MKKLVYIFIVAAVALVIMSVLPLSGEASGVGKSPQLAPRKSFGPITFPTPTPAAHFDYPTPNPGNIDIPIDIPDYNLNNELHTLCGVPASEPLKLSDLMGLTGYIDLSHKGIVLMEGIQYCNKVTNLDMSENDVVQIPDDINRMDALESLNLTYNNITRLPEAIWQMPDLQCLYISYNELESLPPGIENTQISTLQIAHNQISQLPDNIGQCSFVYLLANGNKIEYLPDSIGESTKLVDLTLNGNRLTSIPESFRDNHYYNIHVEWNFIDMSQGSHNRSIMESITADESKNYLRQLLPLQNLRATATNNSVTLKWDQPGSGDDGDATWGVKNYYIYRMQDGSFTFQTTLDPNVTSYTQNGLDANTGYKYRIYLEYNVLEPYNHYEVSQSSDITVSTTRAAGESSGPLTSENNAEDVTTAQTSPSIQTPAPIASNEPVEEAAAEDASSSGFPLWGILLIAAGVMLIAAVIVLAIIIKKQKPGKAD